MVLDLSFLTLRNVLIWIGAWSLVGFVIMGEDKDLARSQEGAPHPSRISEKTLHEVSLMGGFPGIIIGARIFHHKTSKSSFWPPVGASVLVWIALLFVLAKYDILKIVV